MKTIMAFPRRAGDPIRDRLWEYTQDYWDRLLPDVERYTGIHHKDEGPFNRSVAVNRAVGTADEIDEWDVVVIMDGDIVVPPEQLLEAAERAHRERRVVLAYDQYLGLNAPFTAKILQGFQGNWAPGVILRMKSHVSSCVAVPRFLWNVTGGFDERFVGWGFEDSAFICAARTIGGGIARVKGNVWHLHHPASPERNPKTAEHRAGAALATRYFATVDPEAMELFIDERFPASTILAVITDGRADCLERTLRSADAALQNACFTRKVIFDDSADIEYQAHLRARYREFEVMCGPKRLGFGGNVSRAWDTCLASGQQWIFWLEDDFEFKRPVDMWAMRRVLTDNPHLFQMALRRQAWFHGELEAGGVIEQDPSAYEEHSLLGGVEWLEHRKFLTTNPSLFPRRTLAGLKWPTGNGSEKKAATQLFGNPSAKSGYWGSRTDEPWVEHIGERQGTGY